MQSLYYGVNDVEEILRSNKRQSYTIIRKLNGELKEKGYITIARKVPKKYLEERCYGLAEKQA